MASTAVTDNQGPSSDIEPGRGSRVGAILVFLAGGLFLVYAAAILNAPFGDSHDGRNAGVWAAGSRALREEGPVESRLGTRSSEGGTYANHPPLIYVETAVAEAVGGGGRLTTRAPAWVGSVLAIVLLARLLREQGVSAVAAGSGVVLAVATPMFLVYGTMLDTPVTSLGGAGHRGPRAPSPPVRSRALSCFSPGSCGPSTDRSAPSSVSSPTGRGTPPCPSRPVTSSPAAGRRHGDVGRRRPM